MNPAIRNLIAERLLLAAIAALAAVAALLTVSGCIAYKSAPVMVNVDIDGRDWTNSVLTNITVNVEVHDNVFEAGGAEGTVKYK